MDRRASLHCLAAGLVATALGCAAPSPATPAIEGTWVVASAALGGKDLPLQAFQNSPLRMAGGRYAFQSDSGEYAVIPGAVPAALEVRGRQGPNAGKTIPAIFKVQGDTLTICYDLSGTARPKDFRSEPGTQLFLARYTRTSP